MPLPQFGVYSLKQLQCQVLLCDFLRFLIYLIWQYFLLVRAKQNGRCGVAYRPFCRFRLDFQVRFAATPAEGFGAFPSRFSARVRHKCPGRGFGRLPRLSKREKTVGAAKKVKPETKLVSDLTFWVVKVLHLCGWGIQLVAGCPENRTNPVRAAIGCPRKVQ